MTGKRLLLFAGTGIGFLLILLLSEKPFGQPPTELALYGMTAEYDSSGRISEVTVTGSGFDRHTRLLLTPDFGNRRALLHSLPTWGILQSVTVAGDLIYLANHYRGVQVFDFSDPARPRQIGSLQLPGTAWKIAVEGKLAAVAVREKGLQVVDTGDPQQLRLLGAIDLGGNALDVVIAGHLAYVANSRSGLQLVDLTDPVDPVLLATLPVAGNPYALTVEDGIAYLAAAGGGLQIVDVRDPRHPRSLGHLKTPEPAFGIALRDGIAWLGAGRAGLLAIDVRTPQAPKCIGGIDTPGTARGIALAGRSAYVADNLSGLQVVDIADPYHPFSTGAYALPGASQTVALFGDRALVASGRNGLQVVDLRQPATPRNRPFADALPVPAGEKREYLAAAGLSEILVIAVRDPLPPEIVARIPTAGSGRNLQVAGNFLYVLSQGTRGQGEAEHPCQLEIFAIDDPGKAWPVNRMQLELPKDLLVFGSNLWVTGKEGLCRFDLADPASPRFAGCLPLPGGGDSLARKDNFLLVGDTQGSLHVIDVTQPEAPRRLGTAALPWHLQAFAASAKVVSSGSLAVVAGGRNGLLVYGIDDPDRPELLGGIQLPEGNHAANVTVSGRTAYVSAYRKGLHLIDFGDPRQLRLLATIGNQGGTRPILVTGKQIVFFSPEEGLCAFPLPVELADVTAETDSRLTAKPAGPIPPGSYTLWAFNERLRAELPGAFIVEP